MRQNRLSMSGALTVVMYVEQTCFACQTHGSAALNYGATSRAYRMAGTPHSVDAATVRKHTPQINTREYPGGIPVVIGSIIS